VRVTEPWDDLAAAQQDLLTRAQLAELGVTRSQLRWRLAHQWQLVLPHVVALDTRRVTGGRRVRAAALEAGDDAVVSGAHACAHHGLDSARLDGPVLVLVPRSRATRSPGFARIRRTLLEPAWTSTGGLRYASAARAVVDHGCTAPSPDLTEAVVIEAVQRRLVTVDELRHELGRRRLNGTLLLARALAVAEAGAWSRPESTLLRAAAASAVLPHVWPNPELRLPDGTRLISPDLWVDDVGLAVMVHSRAFHARDRQWEATVEQDGMLAEHGIIVLAFTGASAEQRPEAAVRRIERAYLTARESGRVRPDVLMTPRGPGLVR
jgi:hypothetical protein